MFIYHKVCQDYRIVVLLPAHSATYRSIMNKLNKASSYINFVSFVECKAYVKMSLAKAFYTIKHFSYG
ncbi:hypothetical protein LguiA_028749 [Lonicera macranthoides]